MKDNKQKVIAYIKEYFKILLYIFIVTFVSTFVIIDIISGIVLKWNIESKVFEEVISAACFGCVFILILWRCYKKKHIRFSKNNYKHNIFSVLFVAFCLLYFVVIIYISVSVLIMLMT